MIAELVDQTTDPDIRIALVKRIVKSLTLRDDDEAVLAYAKKHNQLEFALELLSSCAKSIYPSARA